MKVNWKSPLTKRGLLVGSACFIFLIWNMALSTQRKNVGGTFYDIVEKEIVLKVGTPGKIEPLVQKTIRSELDGRKLGVHVRVGEKVKKGQKLMDISDENIRIEITQKKNSLTNAKSDMIKAKKDYQLESSLYKQQAVPKRDVENAKQTYDRALQAYKVAKQDMELTKKKAKGVKVVSPLDGVVIKNFLEREEWVSTGRELFTIAKLDKFAVRGKVDELDIAQIKVGQPAYIKCDAFPDKIINGTVSWIGAQAGEGAFAEIDVLIDIVDTQGLDLKPNLSADASIIIGRIPKGIVVPSRAVHSSPEGAYVYLHRPGGWLAKKKIIVSRANLGEVVVDSGLRSGQSILVPKEE